MGGNTLGLALTQLIFSRLNDVPIVVTFCVKINRKVVTYERQQS
jgi:hypothetical protein